MIGLVKFIIGLVGAMWLGIAGGWAVYWYDHRPAGVPAPLHAHILFWSHDFGLPPSIAAQRDIAQSDNKVLTKSVVVLRSAVSTQNTAITALKVSSDSWQAASRVATADAMAANAWRMTLAQKIAAMPAPADQSELGLCRAADGVLLEGAQ